jgi:hypothetical protein
MFVPGAGKSADIFDDCGRGKWPQTATVRARARRTARARTIAGYSDAEIDRIAGWLSDGLSGSQIASRATVAFGRPVSRNAAIGIVHRDKRLKAIGFKNPPKNGARGPRAGQAKATKARRAISPPVGEMSPLHFPLILRTSRAAGVAPLCPAGHLPLEGGDWPIADVGAVHRQRRL